MNKNPLQVSLSALRTTLSKALVGLLLASPLSQAQQDELIDPKQDLDSITMSIMAEGELQGHTIETPNLETLKNLVDIGPGREAIADDYYQYTQSRDDEAQGSYHYDGETSDATVEGYVDSDGNITYYENAEGFYDLRPGLDKTEEKHWQGGQRLLDFFNLNEKELPNFNDEDVVFASDSGEDDVQIDEDLDQEGSDINQEEAAAVTSRRPKDD